jgi:hypothetical protein
MKRQVLTLLAETEETLRNRNLVGLADILHNCFDTFFFQTYRQAVLMEEDLYAELMQEPPSEPPRKEEPLTEREVQHAEVEQGYWARNLLAAVVRQAISDWLHYKNHHNAEKRRHADSAQIWLFEEDEHHLHWQLRRTSEKDLTSFIRICHALGYDPDEKRRFLSTLTRDKFNPSLRPSMDKDSGVHEALCEVHADVPYDNGFDSCFTEG